MKSKNLILALLAVMLAVSSAFSTKNVLTTVHKLKIKQTTASAFVCTPIPVSLCEDIGPWSYVCRVYVTKLNGSTELVNAFGNDIPGCTVPLYHYTQDPAGLYDAGGSRPYDVTD